MASIKIEFGGTFLIFLQIVLLVLYYGGLISAKTPWWVVWLPGLILFMCIWVAGILLTVAMIFASYIGWKINRKIREM